MKLLDRYVIRNFVQVYLYCIAGFTSIWLIFDVSDNISSFIDNHIPQRAGAATGRERQYRHELRGRPGLLPASDKDMGFGERAACLLRCDWKHHQGRLSSYANDRTLDRNTVPTEQRERASGSPVR